MGVDRVIGTMAGNYKLVERLGAGGMGEVYKGVHATIGSRVAIKLLNAIAARDASLHERFIIEAQAVNRIEHDGVVKIIDAGKLHDGRPYLVMELLHGESLHQIVKRGRMPIGDACAVMIDVLDALVAAHAAGVVHRDLKPPNVFRTNSGRIVVLDFGIAKLMSPDAKLQLTLTGVAVGTPHYMAPEQIRGLPATPAVDIYAAGVLLFELVCGRRPFEGDQDESIFEGHLTRRPPPPRALEPSVSIALQDVILAALAKEPAKRHANAAVMRDALRAAIAKPAEAIGAMPSEQHTLRERPKASPWARPDPNAPARTPSRDDRQVVMPPAKIPDTVPDRTPRAVVAHRERSRTKWIVVAGVATIAIITTAVLASTGGEQRAAPPARTATVEPKPAAPPEQAATPPPVAEPPAPPPTATPSAPAPAPKSPASPAAAVKKTTKTTKPAATSAKLPDRDEVVNPFAAPVSAAQSSQAALARQAIEQGDTQYNLGNFYDAIRLYKNAYSRAPQPIVLLKIADAYQQLEEHDDVLYFLKRYLALDPNARNKREIEARIAETERHLDEIKALSTKLK